MESFASLMSLGSVNMISFGNFDSSVCSVRRVSSPRNSSSSRRFWSCKPLSPAPEPVLKSGSKSEPLLNMPWGESKFNSNSDSDRISDKEYKTSKVMESLGEVLEKVEKLEISKKVNVSVDKSSSNEPKNGKAVKSVENLNHKSKTLKSIWRKGNPVATVQKVVKEPLRQEPPVKHPQPHQKLQPTSQSKFFIKKPVILKDVNAAVKSPVGSETGLAAEKKERKPILIDRFASKKPVVGPLIAPAILAPPKPNKAPVSKFQDEFRKKSGPSGGLRRRVTDDGISDKDKSELNRPPPGTVNAQKGRKWSKTSRKAVRLQAARDSAPVRVEIMEVSEDGMLTDELAHNLAISEGAIFGFLHSKGIKPDGVHKVSKDVVKMICKEYEVEVIDGVPLRVEDMAKKKEILDEDDLDKLEDRPPVLTIMGHVDHGKTTLLDYIRKSKVAAVEAGGITQGIGAYKVQVLFDGKKQTCVFLDTPGHEAFGAMRARGARVTDIAVIVVAADDGIRPQTSEAIAHAKAARVPIIIAINKIDMDGANPDRVIQDLSSIGLVPEEWGGDVPMVKISALKGKNVDDLLEIIMLLAEFGLLCVLLVYAFNDKSEDLLGELFCFINCNYSLELQELKANPHRKAKGTVIEAGLDKSKGPVATFIVQNGTLRRGDILVCGEASGKVRALFDDNGKRVDEAGPSIPVQVIGLNNVPLAGDEFEVLGSLDIAREKAESRAEYLRNERIIAKAGDGKITLSSYASAVSSGKRAGLDLHQLNIILKVDLQGSIEAIRQALQVLPQDNITLKFLLQATGDVSTSDVDLAVASKAIIFGFNVKIPGSVKSYANNRNVEIQMYKVIYELIDNVRSAMEGLLDLVEEQVLIGSAEVRAVFSSGSSRVAGCMVTEGKVVKDCGIRVLRKGKEVHAGILNSLKRVKEMVKEVNAGLECGIGIEGFNDWETGDSIETFNTMRKKRTLEEASASISAALQEQGLKL
ncbi:Translation initiation factor IF-2, chloroplastic [Orobanche minor]